MYGSLAGKIQIVTSIKPFKAEKSKDTLYCGTEIINLLPFFHQSWLLVIILIWAVKQNCAGSIPTEPHLACLLLSDK